LASFEELGIQTKPGKVDFYTVCPFCSKDRKKSSDPCLFVHDEPDNQYYSCQHCGEKGNIGVQDRYEKVKEKARIPKNPGQLKAYSKDISAYFNNRGITTGTLLKEEIYEPSGNNKVVGFPFYISKTLVNVKFLNIDPPKGKPKWFQLPKNIGTKTCFLGLQNLNINMDPKRQKKNFVIICEGEFDWLTWKGCGFKNVLSVPMGAPSEKAKDFSKEFEYVTEKYFQSLRPYIDVFYLSVDEDGPGKVLRDQLALQLGKERCRVIKYPTGHKDINAVLTHNKELTMDFDREAVKTCFKEASSYPIKGIIKPSDCRVELEAIAKGGLPPGLGIGIPEFDYLMTLKRKLTSYWTGIANMGKSTFVRWVLIKLVQNNPDLNLKFGLYTPENRPAVREFVMISQILTGKRFQRGFWNSMNEDQRRKSLNFIEKHFFLVAPGPRNYEDFGGKIKVHQASTLDGIMEYFAYLAKTEGIFGYLIDAWNKIQHQVPKGMTDTNYIEQSLDRLLEFNDYYDCHGAIIAHPTKLELNKKTGKYEIPSMYDIKGSSAWYDRADYGVVIHRNIWRGLTDQEKMDQDDEDDRTYVTRHDAPSIMKTEKIRFEETGNKDMVRFDKESTGGFRVYEKDRGMHVGRYKQQKEREDNQRLAEEAKAQQSIPDFIDITDKDEEDDLPF